MRMALLLGVLASFAAADVLVSSLDAKEPARGISITADAGKVEIQPAQGNAVQLPTARVVEILTVPAPAAPPAATRAFEVELSDGTRLRGKLGDGTEDDLVLLSPTLGRTKISMERVRVVRRVHGMPEGGPRHFPRLPEFDVAYRLTGSRVKGTVGRFAAVGVEVEREGFDQPTVIPHAQLAAVLVDNPPAAPVAGLLVVARLADGSAIRLLGKSFKVAAGMVRGETPVGLPVACNARSIVALHFQGASFLHLSDLKPKTVERTPFFPIPEGPSADALLEFVCPVRMDRSPDDRPITLAKRRYFKGIGVRPRTELTYALEKKFSRFEAWCGIDDEVLGPGYGRGGGTGSVVFAVEVDGKEVWRSTRAQGGAPPQPVDVPLVGASTLTLVVMLVPPAEMPAGIPDSPELDNAVWARPLLIR